ncbi:MAG: phage major capsid protein [Desulfobacteria bacterium]
MPRTTVEEIQAAVESFIEKHNGRYTALERRLDGVEAKGNRPGFAGAVTETGPAAEHRKAFAAFLRKGIVSGLEDLQIRAAVTTASDPDGGYGVPEAIDKEVGALLTNVSPMRRVCKVITAGTPDYKKLVRTSRPSSGWVGETEARPETTTPALAALSPFWGEIYANPAASQQSLDDIFFNVEEWLAEAVAEEFAIQEGDSFTKGNGVKKPKGILSYATSLDVDGVRVFGTLQHVITGAAGGFLAPTAAISPADCLISLVYSLKARHRAGAIFMMNKKSLETVRKFKDAVDGQFIWQRGAAAGQPSTLLGFPIEENEDFPDIGAGAFPIAFGNFKAAYQIVDRFGIRVLRDPYTSKPSVLFYSTKRTGGHLIDSEAVKLLKVSA